MLFENPVASIKQYFVLTMATLAVYNGGKGIYLFNLTYKKMRCEAMILAMIIFKVLCLVFANYILPTFYLVNVMFSFNNLVLTSLCLLFIFKGLQYGNINHKKTIYVVFMTFPGLLLISHIGVLLMNICVPFECSPILYPVRLIYMESADFLLELYTLCFYYLFLKP